MGVSKNSGIPKWMVYKGKPENPIKMDDLGVPLFLETPIICYIYFVVRVGGLEFNDSYEKTFLVVEVRDSQKEQGPETTKVAPFVKYGTETNI